MKHRKATYPAMVLALVMFVSLAAVPPSAYARGFRGGTPPSADEIVSRMDRRLNLTDEQESKMTAILEATMAKRKAAHEKTRAEMERLREDTNASIEGILDETQAAEFKKMQEQRRQKFQSKQGGGKQGRY